MAKCEKTPVEFVLSAFRPRVAVMTSPEVEVICQRNYLSLTEMLQPFSKLQTEAVQYRDPLGNQVTVHNLHLWLEDWQQSAAPTAAVARRLLSECVSQSLLPPAEDGSVRPNTPWFELWRDRLLQMEPPGEHEFSRRYIACILAVSSGSAAGPLQQLQRLVQQQHQLQHQQPVGGQRWFSNNVLIYHLLVTDTSAVAEESAESVYEQIKTTYGAHCCHHLRLNSRPPEHQDPHVPDPWAPFVRDRPNNTDAPSSQMSGADTPAEVAQLTSLPSLVVEGGLASSGGVADHPLSPESRAVSPTPPAPRSPQLVPAAVGTGTGGASCIVVESGGSSSPIPVQGVVVNRVSYPTLANAVTGNAQSHGACLSASDIDRINIFISELCVRGLLPHVERQMRALSDVVNNRKGMSRSLLSATKRWFGGNKPGSSAAVTSVIYSQEAPEIQVRRLGDLAFIFGHYDLAYQAYHTAKRDFSADSAWLHFAGAVEMAALAVFLHTGAAAAKPFPQHYLDQAIATYLDSCRVPECALRATLFSTECLKARGQWGEAALQFIRLTAEDADLRSALLLEQAAHCFLNSQPSALRKYAFHMILSGHRFSKAGQRRHSLRAYKQAFQVYEGHGWRLADDHIAFTLARHSEALQEHAAALSSLERLLAAAASASDQTRQAPAQQAAFVREYLHVHRHQHPSSPSPAPLPLPLLLAQQTRVLTSEQQRVTANSSQQQRFTANSGGKTAAEGEDWTPATGATFSDDEEENARWYRLEELCLGALGQSNVVFRPTIQCMTGKTNNVASPRVAAGESVRVQLVLRNPLRVALELSELRLRFSFEPRPIDGSATAEGVENVVVETLPRCVLEETSTQEVTLSVTVHVPGLLHILGYEYSLALAVVAVAAADSAVQSQEPTLTVRGHQPISVRGRRLNATKEERSKVVHAEDKRLEISVEDPGARLQVAFRGFPSSLLCGQIQPVLLRVTNTGRRPVQRLLLATPDPQLICLETQVPPEGDRWQQVRPVTGADQSEPCTLSWSEAARISRVTEILLPEGSLCAGASVTRRLWVRAPHADGRWTLGLLLCWCDGGRRPRLLRHAGRLLVTPSVHVAVRAVRSVGPQPRLQMDMEVSGSQAGDAPVVLQTVAVASSRWRLVTDQPPPAVGVMREETALLGVTVERVKEQTTDSGDPLLQLAQISLDTEKTRVSTSPSVDFLLRHKVHPGDLLSGPGPGAPVDHNPVSAADARQAAALAAAVEVAATVVLHWRTQGVNSAAGAESTIYGQHHVSADALDASAATYPAVSPAGGDTSGATESEPRPPVTIISTSPEPAPPAHWPGEGVMERLVTITPLHRPSVTHDFSRKRLCVIPVTMQVQNHSSSQLVVHLSAVSAGVTAPRTALPYSSHVSSDLVWVGRTHPVVTVPATSSAHLRLAAAVTRPGLYDLGSVGVACRRVDGDDSELTEQTTRIESAVVVRDVSDDADQ